MAALDTLARFVARHGSRPRSVLTRAVALLGGATAFFFFVPLLVALASRPLARLAAVDAPRRLELVVGGAAVILGGALVLWAVVTFWRAGRGTPVPFASPQRLVTSGPFAWCRNPMKLGVCTTYLGIGTLAGSLAAGVIVFLVVIALGSAYHRLIEERELALRFGAAYEDYRRRTPFLIPRLRHRGTR